MSTIKTILGIMFFLLIFSGMCFVGDYFYEKSHPYSYEIVTDMNGSQYILIPELKGYSLKKIEGTPISYP